MIYWTRFSVQHFEWATSHFHAFGIISGWCFLGSSCLCVDIQKLLSWPAYHHRSITAWVLDTPRQSVIHIFGTTPGYQSQGNEALSPCIMIRFRWSLSASDGVFNQFDAQFQCDKRTHIKGSWSVLYSKLVIELVQPWHWWWLLMKPYEPILLGAKHFGL